MTEILAQIWAERGPEIMTALATLVGALVVQVLNYYGVKVSAEKEKQLDVATRKAIAAIEEQSARAVKQGLPPLTATEKAALATEMVWEEVRPKGLAVVGTLIGLVFKSFKKPTPEKIEANIDANLASMGQGASQPSTPVPLPDPVRPVPRPFPSAG